MTVLVNIIGALLLYGISVFGFMLAKKANLILADTESADSERKINFAALLMSGLSAALWLIGTFINEFDSSIVRNLLDILFLATLTLLAYIDLKRHIVPNKILMIMLVIWVMISGVNIILSPAEGIEQTFRALSGAFIGGLIFLLCYLLSRRQLGGGDVKLAFIMGLYLTGERIMGAIFYGVLLSCIYSIVQLCRKKVGMKDGIPLVPFLYIGTLIVMLL